MKFLFGEVRMTGKSSPFTLGHPQGTLPFGLRIIPIRDSRMPSLAQACTLSISPTVLISRLNVTSRHEHCRRLISTPFGTIPSSPLSEEEGHRSTVTVGEQMNV
jgi:hypothetical protein